MDEQLALAVARALQRDRGDCAAYGRQFSWRRSAEEFLQSLHWLPESTLAHAA
jgi:hypothetical protein